MSVKQLKRPTGLAVIAILWFLWSVGNLFMISVYINSDLTVMAVLSDPSLPEWVKSAIPVELVINCVGFALLLIILFACYGLFTGKPWSHKIALASVMLALILNVFAVVLYMSAPVELGFDRPKAIMRLPIRLLWTVVLWIYLI
jgi:hypothetical protein